MPYQRKSQHRRRSGNSSGRMSSTRFRGVLSLTTGKWGARISFNYKAYWLGTYQREEDAAIAYDRASLKLERSDSTFNFPRKFYTAEERSFQSLHSVQDILSMIKDKTYPSNFAGFLAGRSTSGGQVNPKEISYQLLFHRELTQTDLDPSRGFLIPEEYALQHFPPLRNSSDGGQTVTGAVDLTFYDKHNSSWTFRYSYWSSTQSFLFTKGWRQFVVMNNLNAGDTVIFYECTSVEAGETRKCYMIDMHHKVAGSNNVGGHGEHGTGVDDIQGVEKNTGVKLFGVQMG